ncbi:unnamed protein product [Chondrus crispus]|uniref:Uncharacterized protein n=1 Tax=Chondrus crispus TaxID=2769 RepID=R7QMP6_CHOCR|nr:unnamed protein product [Chondrus crispus]CDF39013.1 unnamed protein product [Chondrus crispus]|eukprot:XP_005718918.1 unnamed protein product [Chondrus crispus]
MRFLAICLVLFIPSASSVARVAAPHSNLTGRPPPPPFIPPATSAPPNPRQPPPDFLSLHSTLHPITPSASYASRRRAFQPTLLEHTAALPLFSILTHRLQPARTPNATDASAAPRGLTLDACATPSACAAMRRCLDISSFPSSTLCSAHPECFCLPPEPQPCASTAQCVPGEVCVMLPDFPTSFCVSAAVERHAPAFTEIPADHPHALPDTALSGLTFDYCQEQRHCAGDRDCTFFDGIDSMSEPCEGRDPCICLPPSLRSCYTVHDCPKGEICVTYPSREIQNVCLSASTATAFPDVFLAPSPTPGTTTANASGRLTLEKCMLSTECVGTRECYRSPPSARIPCPSTLYPNCRCFPIQLELCSDSGPCETGEVCAIERDTSASICVSQNAIEKEPDLIVPKPL